jgi:cholesterol transport system auxiliary component
MRAANAAVPVALLILAGGCSNALLGPEVEPPEIYRLGPPAITNEATLRLPVSLTVARPRAAPSLDTDRIATVHPGLRFDYYVGLRWSETAPQMIQSLLVSSLQSTGRYEAVLSAPSRVPPELLLDVELQRLEARYPTSVAAPVIQVQMQLSLVDARRGQRLSSFVASGEAPAAAASRGEVLAAFERATGQALGGAASWLISVPPRPDP